MKLLITIFLIGFASVINAQNNNEFSKVDNIALKIPDSMTRTTSGLSDYINDNFSRETDKSRAIFVWIANNIRYDIENISAVNTYKNTGEIIDKVLKTRKGVCMHYAELYNEVANMVGIKSFVIPGYTKQNGSVDKMPHAWCASLIGSTWFLIDPTWGSGYIQNSGFVKKISDVYFKAKPEQFIKSHMPFDPLWQFLNYPITNLEFYEGKFDVSRKRPYFNYLDTLRKYEQETEIEKLVSANNRIEKNGIKNSLILDQLKNNKREIEYYREKQTVEMFNSAVNMYNEGINQLNEFINYRNKRFLPGKPDSDIKKMIDQPEYILINSQRKLKEIKYADSETAHLITQFSKSVGEALRVLNEQKIFVNKYLKSEESLRNSLFYK